MNWNEMELDKSIVHLEFSKAQTTDDEKKWRPTNHSVEEQFRPAIIRELSKRKNLLQRQLNFQNGVIEELVVALEQYRTQMKEQSHNRQQIVAHTEQDNSALTNVEDQLTMIHEILNAKSSSVE